GSRPLTINGVGQKVFTTSGGLGERGRGDSGRGLGRQLELEAADQEVELGFRLGVSGQLDFTPVGGGQVDVYHLDGGELFQCAAGGQARRQGMEAAGQGD